MTITVANMTHAKLSDSAKRAELEAEAFYGNIENEEETLYRLEKLYEICGRILGRGWARETVSQLALKADVFSEEEISLIENAHQIHLSEDGEHFEKMAVINWMIKVSRAYKAGYNNNDYDHVVENLFDMIRFS